MIKLRILVAEDDDGVAGAVIEALGAHGHAAVRAATAAQIRGRLRDADVVLLDLGLPDGDGLDVQRRSAATFRGFGFRLGGG